MSLVSLFMAYANMGPKWYIQIGDRIVYRYMGDRGVFNGNVGNLTTNGPNHLAFLSNEGPKPNFMVS